MDPWLDGETEPIRRRVLEPLALFITELGPSRGSLRLLDIGCGDHLLSRILGDPISVDGWDPSPQARAAATSRVENLDAIRIFETLSEAPDDAYDGVVLSSVIQYLSGTDELQEILFHAARCLRPGSPVGVIITDMATGRRRRVREAVDLLGVCIRVAGPMAGSRSFVAAVSRPPVRTLSLTVEDLEATASRAELQVEALPQNLSPLTTRTSFRLIPHAGLKGRR